MKNTLLKLLAATVAVFATGPSIAAWEQRSVDVGGMPWQEMAISGATSRAYIPLLQQRALAVFDGSEVSRIELDIKPTGAAYSAATGRVFVVGMFDNALVAIDEATGSQARIALGAYPDNMIVDDARGKLFVSRWGGIRAEGGVAVVDTRTLAVRDVPLGGYVTGMVQDTNTGHLFVTAGEGSLVELDSEGNVVARVGDLGHQALSLAVDSRSGRVYLAGLSHPPYRDPGNVNRTFRIYAGNGLQLVSQQVWPSGGDWYKLNFMIDPAQPGLYLSSGGNNMLLWLDADGNNLKTWQLPLGDTLLYDGRRVVNGIFGLDSDPATGRIFVSSPTGGLVTEFDPATGAADTMSIPGAVGFTAVRFWPDSSRMLVLDSGTAGQVTLFERAP